MDGWMDGWMDEWVGGKRGWVYLLNGRALNLKFRNQTPASSLPQNSSMTYNHFIILGLHFLTGEARPLRPDSFL